MRLMPVTLLALVGCSQSDSVMHERFVDRAIACVEEQVPDGELVSAELADSVVEGCRHEFERWTRVQLEDAYKQPFDDSDPEMQSVYNRELDDKIELMKLRISNGTHQKLPKI